MRLVRLSTLVALALFAFGAFSTAAASAEETGILCLVKGCQELTGTFKTAAGVTSRLVPLTTKGIEAETAEMSLKNCEAVAGTEEKHVTLCKDVPLTFTGVKVEGTITKCNTEGDAAGTAKLLLELHTATELSTSKALEPLLLMQLLNAKLETKEVPLKCGAMLKFLAKGTLGCLLLPGLANIAAGGAVEVKCAQKEKDPVTGECELLCEWLIAAPFEASFAAFEDAWGEVGLKGTLSKDVFIDD